MRKIIYDIGSNNGDDIKYYLNRSDVVVAVEANPDLCSLIRNRFKSEIDNSTLFVENYALTGDASTNYIDFYIHNENHVLSQMERPDNSEDFTKIKVESTTMTKLIEKYGEPFYAKIDIEGGDNDVLCDLMSAGVKPSYISAECHDLRSFTTMVCMGYNSFKIMRGRYVSDIKINLNDDNLYTFPVHSAGPFGNDIPGPWMTLNTIFRILAFEGFGWKDVHASKIDIPDEQFDPRFFDLIVHKISRTARDKMRGVKGN